VARVTLDGNEQPDKLVALADDRQDHRVEVELL
jgi:hypothetical protein